MMRAFFAAVIATAIVSAIIYVNELFDFPVRFDLLGEIATFNERLGLPVTERALWTTHAIVGIALWGMAFAVLAPILPEGATASGLVFGAIAFVAMMTIFMPLAAHEPFGRDLGAAVIGGGLVINLGYGLFLGLAYTAFSDQRN